MSKNQPPEPEKQVPADSILCQNHHAFLNRRFQCMFTPSVTSGFNVLTHKLNLVIKLVIKNKLLFFFILWPKGVRELGIPLLFKILISGNRELID
jgi:hypothetical protein